MLVNLIEFTVSKLDQWKFSHSTNRLFSAGALQNNSAPALFNFRCVSYYIFFFSWIECSRAVGLLGEQEIWASDTMQSFGSGSLICPIYDTRMLTRDEHPRYGIVSMIVLATIGVCVYPKVSEPKTTFRSRSFAHRCCCWLFGALFYYEFQFFT